MDGQTLGTDPFDAFSQSPNVGDWIRGLALVQAKAAGDTRMMGALIADALHYEPPRLLPLLRAVLTVIPTTNVEYVAALRRKVEGIAFDDLVSRLRDGRSLDLDLDGPEPDAHGTP